MICSLRLGSAAAARSLRSAIPRLRQYATEVPEFDATPTVHQPQEKYASSTLSKLSEQDSACRVLW